MSRLPLVSIITPSYNQGNFIEDTLRSVKDQSYPNIEHIVIDGGSTDDTLNKLEEYEGKYNLNWISEQDNGQANAINKGFEIAKGKITTWINSDDVYFDKNVIRDVVTKFLETREKLIYGDSVIINQDNLICRVGIVRSDVNFSLLLRSCFPCQPSVFMKKKITEEHKLKEDLDYSFDYEYWLRLAKEGIIFRRINRICACRRRHSSAKSVSGTKTQNRESKRIRKGYSTNSSLAVPFLNILDPKISGAVRRAKGIPKLLDIYSNRNDYEFAFEPRFDSIGRAFLRQLFYPNPIS